jgi:hypothetical protein
MSVPQHIVDRLEDYLDGKLDQAGEELVTAWLGQSEGNARAVAVWFKNEVELLEAARVADLCAVFEGLPFEARVELPQSKPAVKPRRRFTTVTRFHSIAAALLIATTAGYFYWIGRGEGGGQSAAKSVMPAVEVVDPPPAILARLANCVWAADMAPLRVGQELNEGTTLHLKSGLAQLVFESGAEVVLSGPCHFQIDNSMLCRLTHGSVSAEVPPRAAGFTIRSPMAEVIDLGTRFGFSVGDAGKSEVHVFQGEVISRQLDERGEVIGRDIRLRQNQAVLFPGERKQARRLAANEAKFALEVRPLWTQDTIEPLVIDRQVALWLRAEHGVLTDNDQRVIAWQDLALGDNEVANDAFQPDDKSRPRYVADGINGRPAIRFDGKRSNLTTTPMTTTDNQTIVVAFEYLRPEVAGDRVGGQIINYNGPPSRFLPDAYSPGVLQMGEKVATWNGPKWSIAAKAFVGKDSRGKDFSAGVTVSKSLGPLTPRVVAYVYNNSENRAVLFVDGVRVAQASAPTSVAVTSRKVIGKHGIFDQWYFHGDLAEVLVFNAALRPKEVKAISQQLMNRYGIPSAAENGGNSAKAG